MKQRVEDLKCFQQVADVIGTANAKRELFKVLESDLFSVDEVKVEDGS